MTFDIEKYVSMLKSNTRILKFTIVVIKKASNFRRGGCKADGEILCFNVVDFTREKYIYK